MARTAASRVRATTLSLVLLAPFDPAGALGEAADQQTIVTVRLEGGVGPKLELKRIYDLALPAAESPAK